MTTLTGTFDFALDAAREAHAPAELSGHGRDDVRLLATDLAGGTHSHHEFAQLQGLLRSGDLLVVNNSATLPAAVWLDRLVVHFSGQSSDGDWLVELRERDGHGHRPYSGGRPGESLLLPGGTTLKLHDRHTGRLWRAQLDASAPIYLEKYGRAIRYDYIPHDYPLQTYQTVFATEPGSAEMPSAARPFTTEMVTRLVSNGVGIAPITLHTGVASPEVDEPPYAEYFRVPEHTARAVNLAHTTRSRVIAVGTTVVRALESADRKHGLVQGSEGWSNHVVTPEVGAHVVDGLLTGLHEPRSTHLAMLSTFINEASLSSAYQQAIAEGYLWHEFGDVHLIA